MQIAEESANIAPETPLEAEEVVVADVGCVLLFPIMIAHSTLSRR